jgi:hypothetical protein
MAVPQLLGELQISGFGNGSEGASVFGEMIVEQVPGAESRPASPGQCGRGRDENGKRDNLCCVIGAR